MGRDKALLPWPPQPATAPAAAEQPISGGDFYSTATVAVPGTFLSAQIDLLRRGTDLVLVVAGRNAAALQPVTNAMGAYLVENPDPDRGQFSSLQVGLQEVLNRGRDAAIVALVDRPPASIETVEALRRAFMESEAKQTWAVVPEHGGHHGHPIIVGREMISAFLSAPATGTARDVEHAVQKHILYVPVADPNVAMNVDTPQDYDRLHQS